MGLSSVVRLWEEWQLRILVLGSLCIQCFLAAFASARKSHIRPLFRFSIWLSYLGSDALAIYALATLFNRQRKLQHSSAVSSSSHDLEVLWTSVLLMHLGGQVTITAYNIEDNELWKRHILTAISQVTVAIYVFCKSWSASSDKRLLATAILVFIPGVFKCFEKPLALKCASFDGLVSSWFPDNSRTTSANRELELEEYVQKARDSVKRNKIPAELEFHVKPLPGFFKKKRLCIVPDKLFTDVMYPYSDRFANLNSFWSLSDERAYMALRDGLSILFDLVYMKDLSTKSVYKSYYYCAHCTRVSSIILPIAAIGLFHSSHKKVYRGSDVIVTYVLLYITFFIEIFSLIRLSSKFSWGWPETVHQHSLVGFFARNKRHTWLMSIMGCLQLKNFLDKYWCTCSSARAITNLVRGHVKDGWLDYILDAESYRAFSDSRGHWTLKGKGCVQLISESIEKPFDESILLWHVATDFCFHSKGASPDQECASRGREISNYMMHLLFANPDMLMPGSRTNLFTAAYKEIEDLLHGEDLPLVDEKELAQKITDKVASSSISREGFIHDAWVLSQELMRLGDEQRIWEVIEGVWVEMICFSAGRCRGFLHAKSLGSGGEYLSFIWLLMSHAGLETFAERQQRVQLRLPKEERVKIAMQRIQEAASNQATDPSTAQGMVPVKEEENAATPAAASEADGTLKQEANSATTSASQGECAAPTSAPAVEIVVSP